MKKIGILTAVLGSLIVGISYPAIAAPIDGACWVLGVREPDSNIYDGPTTCGDIALSYLTVRGPLKLDSTKITGITTVSGPIKATGATLQDVILEKTLSAETVTLESATLVNGDITFKGKEGIVYVDSASKIKGKVINGKVINQDAPH